MTIIQNRTANLSKDNDSHKQPVEKLLDGFRDFKIPLLAESPDSASAPKEWPNVSEVTGEVYLTDGDANRGPILQEATLADVQRVRRELLIVGSYYISKQEQNQEKFEKGGVDESVDACMRVVAYSDRVAVLADLYECEVQFQEAKTALVDLYRQMYDHSTDLDERRKISEKAATIMFGTRPRHDLKAGYFVRAYRVATAKLQRRKSLLEQVLMAQMKRSREIQASVALNARVVSSQLRNTEKMDTSLGLATLDNDFEDENDAKKNPPVYNSKQLDVRQNLSHELEGCLPMPTSFYGFEVDCDFDDEDLENVLDSTKVFIPTDEPEVEDFSFDNLPTFLSARAVIPSQSSTNTVTNPIHSTGASSSNNTGNKIKPNEVISSKSNANGAQNKRQDARSSGSSEGMRREYGSCHVGEFCESLEAIWQVEEDVSNCSKSLIASLPPDATVIDEVAIEIACFDEAKAEFAKIDRQDGGLVAASRNAHMRDGV